MKYVLGFRQIDSTTLMTTGGKGANLGELSRIESIRVPSGFCITTEAYTRITANDQELNGLLDELAHGRPEERAQLSARIRTVIENIPIPKDIAEEIISTVDDAAPYAVRSSATAEDLPTASFAGQQDTYLNVIGKEAVLQHISKCWASLFTERAVTYRVQNGFDHRKVQLAVVVQQMIFPDVSGILFTADPVSSNRKVLSIDASFGLGEALVAGLVNADNYKVRDGMLIDKNVAAKKLAIYGVAGGGTREEEIDVKQQNQQALTDEQILELAQTGKKIEQHFGQPQDIEWCLADGVFYIVQSRPITTLFPIPETNDQETHLYISVGHQQMMTDPIKPLGISFYQLTAGRPMFNAGGRIFVDIARGLESPATRQTLLFTLGQGDPLLKDALMTILERKDFIRLDEQSEAPGKVISTEGFRTKVKNDPAFVAGFIQQSEATMTALKEKIQTLSGTELLDFTADNIKQWNKNFAESQGLPVILAVMDASAWINSSMKEWLGEKNVADTISQSVPNNITSEMGLALLDVADVIRPYPAIIGYLQTVKDDQFLDELLSLEGGQQVRDAIHAFLEKYGVRCAGEIDITRPRWIEKPATLVPMILSNIRNQEPNASKRKFEQGRQEALQKEQEILERLKQLPDGEAKAEETKRMIDLIRNFAGYREYPKYSIVSRYWVYKQALLKEAAQLVQAGIIQDKEDIFYLFFEELHEVVRTRELDYEIITKRKEDYRRYEKLTPPRVVTSDGEIVTGSYKREDLPTGAIAGLAVSSGVVEGRARVIVNQEDADLEAGDILVTAFTDPSWTPLFVSIKGLVTEVGGLMTHGAVIAREYGLPAVVGVENATKLIKDGQRIRVNGTDGYVEIL